MPPLVEGDITTQDFIERILQERDLAVRLAESEREKAALNLRTALEREIAAGDDRLADHVNSQVEQIKQALASLKELLGERDGRMDDRFESHKEAITKAETSLNSRLEGMNEFREQLKEQSSTFITRDAIENINKQTAALIERNREDIQEGRLIYLPVKAFEAAIKPLDDGLAALQRWQFKIAGAIAILTLILPLVTGLLVYFLTRTAIPIDGLSK